MLGGEAELRAKTYVTHLSVGSAACIITSTIDIQSKDDRGICWAGIDSSTDEYLIVTLLPSTRLGISLRL